MTTRTRRFVRSSDCELIHEGDQWHARAEEAEALVAWLWEEELRELDRMCATTALRERVARVLARRGEGR